MSAFLGIYQRNHKAVSKDLLTALLVENGNTYYDGSASWVGANSGLASQFSWISPQEVGEQQPLSSRDGKNLLVADLRLDNREELARDLNLDPGDLTNLSDARLLLLAYRRWSTECVQKLLGDFAFAIWDEQQQQLFVARDPLGVRLAYYYDSGDLFIAASNIESILAHPAVKPKINEGMVAEYLAALWDNHEESFYEDIFYCPPGHCLVANREGLKKWRYWDFDPDYHISYRSDQEYADHYLELLRQAVRCRMRSTGKIGISLSGGLDSTPVAALASEMLPAVKPAQQKLPSFSYVFDHCQACDERHYIDLMVQEFALDSHYILGDGLWPLRDLASWPVLCDPISFDPYISLTTALAKTARNNGCRLLLTGYYGDMLYAGSDHWAADMIYDRRWKSLFNIAANRPRQVNWRRDLINNGLAHLLAPAVRQVFPRRRPGSDNPAWAAIDSGLIQRANLAERSWIRPDYRQFPRPAGWYRRNRLTNAYSQKILSALRWQWNRLGVERYDIFLDRRLVEFAMAVPAYQLGMPGRANNRRVLRQAMKGILPEPIRLRTGKAAFYDFFEDGVLKKERQKIEQLMTNPAVIDLGFVNPEWLAEHLPDGCGRDEAGFTLWRAVSLELWLQRYWVK